METPLIIILKVSELSWLKVQLNLWKPFFVAVKGNSVKSDKETPDETEGVFLKDGLHYKLTIAQHSKDINLETLINRINDWSLIEN